MYGKQGKYMKLLKKMATAFRNRKKYTYAELNDWMLSLIGISSFLVGLIAESSLR